MANILVVDDEIGIRELLSEILGDEGHVVHLAENAAQARAFRQQEAPDLVLLDIWMPDTDGVTLLKEWSSVGSLTMPVIMMSGHATIDTAVEATRIGAIDFLEKPIALQKLLRAVQKGLERGAGVLRTVGIVKPVSSFSSDHQGSDVRGSVGNQAEPHRLETPSNMLAKSDMPLDLPLREARDAFERAYFEYHLGQENGSMTRVAEKTGLERTHLYRKLKQLGIELTKANRK
jgi:DNA-binding NtrC family response regulator